MISFTIEFHFFYNYPSPQDSVTQVILIWVSSVVRLTLLLVGVSVYSFSVALWMLEVSMYIFPDWFCLFWKLHHKQTHHAPHIGTYNSIEFSGIKVDKNGGCSILITCLLSREMRYTCTFEVYNCWESTIDWQSKITECRLQLVVLLHQGWGFLRLLVVALNACLRRRLCECKCSLGVKF